jgi:hypothetical protein
MGALVKFVQLSIAGKSCLCRAEDLFDLLEGGEDSDPVALQDVWMTEEEYAALPKFQGWPDHPDAPLRSLKTVS